MDEPTDMNNFRTNHFLVFAFSFYIFAQAFQQYVLLIGPLASIKGIEQSIIAGQHTLNSVRHYLVYASMFFMVPAFTVLSLRFYKQNRMLSIIAIIFFLLFCSLEIAYRSVHIFQVLNVWGKEFVETEAAYRENLLLKFQYFYQTVNAIYFPLLTSLLIGSGCLCVLSYKSKDWLLFAAMLISSVQQISRLTSYTPIDFLDVFNGIWYFVMVLITFLLLVIWAAKHKSH